MNTNRTKLEDWVGSERYDNVIEAALKVGDMRTNYTPEFLPKDASRYEQQLEEAARDNYRDVVGGAVIDFARQDGYDLVDENGEEIDAEDAYEVVAEWKDFD